MPCPMSGLPHPTFLPDPGTNPAALASWEVISSSTLFSLLTGNLHQLFRLLSEGAEQTQPQQDTQVGAVWRKLGQTHSIPLHPQPVSMGCVPHLGTCACPGVWLCSWQGVQVVHGTLRLCPHVIRVWGLVREAGAPCCPLSAVVAPRTEDLGTPFLALLCRWLLQTLAVLTNHPLASPPFKGQGSC